MIALLIALAGAEEPTDLTIVDEVIVHGDLLIERARREVANELSAKGFTDVIEKEDYVIYRNEQSWKGELRLYHDGWAVMKRQPVQFHPASVSDASKATTVQWLACIWFPSCLSVKGQTLGGRKWMAQKVSVLEDTEAKIAAWGDLVADKNVADAINGLDPRLNALWSDGVPLEGDAPLRTLADRRAALLQFWESRTDTPWGDRVRLAVESFIRDEVQYSDAPFTPGEIAAVNRERHGTRALDLEAPWAEVSAGVSTGAF